MIMFNILRRSVTLGALAAVICTSATTTTATHEIPLKSRTAGQYTGRTFLLAPDFVTYPQLGFPLGAKFIRIHATGLGNSTHLGKYGIVFSFDVHFAIIDGALTTVSDGTFVATAANGDTVSGTFTNYRVIGQNTFTGDAEYTGGTGRFEGITAYETTVGEVFPDPVTGLDSFYYEHEGTASSVGAGKRN